MTWERTFGVQVVIPWRSIADSPQQWSAAATGYLRCRLKMTLRDHGWSTEWLRRAAPPLTLSANGSGDFWVRNKVLVRAECRALDLRTADMLPEKMPLWRWKWLP